MTDTQIIGVLRITHDSVSFVPDSVEVPGFYFESEADMDAIFLAGIGDPWRCHPMGSTPLPWIADLLKSYGLDPAFQWEQECSADDYRD